jgi:hypothetical protein
MMFSNEGLGGGGQRAQMGGKMSGTGGWVLQAGDGYGTPRAKDWQGTTRGVGVGNRVQRIWLFLKNEEYRPFDGCKIEI